MNKRKKRAPVLNCGHCGTLCKRTGKKQIEGYGYSDMVTKEEIPIYSYEYECPECGVMYVWDFFRNEIIEGSFSD